MPNNMHQKWDLIYQKGIGNNFPEPGVIRFLKRNFKYMAPTPFKALEIGCGLGAHTLFMAQYGMDVHALDVSSSALEALNTRAAELQLSNVKTTCETIESIALPANGFDLVLDIACLQHIEASELFETLKKIKRSVAQNGWFYSWFLAGSENINDESFTLSDLNKQVVTDIFADTFKISYDTYKYTEKNGQDNIEFIVFAAQRAAK
jgi:ubiquinone/menaquinone biosynthesis C-methylase UbiE